MKKLSLLIAVFGLFAMAGTVSASTADILQPAGAVTYNEDVTIAEGYNITAEGPGYFQGGLHIDSVTFFNGTAINNSTTDDGEDIPYTVGDNMRVDGRVWRGETAGAGLGDNRSFIIDDDVQITGSLTMAVSDDSDDSGSSTTVAVGDITSVTTASGSGLTGGATSGAVALSVSGVTSAMITNETIVSADIDDGTVASVDIANDAVNSAKIDNETITTDDIDDGTITGDDISNNSIDNDDVAGPGGSNLPTAYGYCEDGVGIADGSTSNVSTCELSGGSYSIPINGITVTSGSYVAIITSDGNSYIPKTSASGGNLTVNFMNYAGNANKNTSFSFVFYEL